MFLDKANATATSIFYALELPSLVDIATKANVKIMTLILAAQNVSPPGNA
jgi:hypothetical protein